MPPYHMRIKIPYRRNSRVTSTIHADTDRPDEFTLQTTENLDPIIQFCQHQRENLRPQGQRDMVPVAEIPLSVVEKMMADGSWDDENALKRWLNDPDNRCFRIWEGKV